jgi:hypothetical protein
VLDLDLGAGDLDLNIDDLDSDVNKTFKKQTFTDFYISFHVPFVYGSLR